MPDHVRAGENGDEMTVSQGNDMPDGIGEDEGLYNLASILYPTTDAAVWAREFCKLHGGDEGLMIGWFANAMETAKTHAQPPERSDLPPEDEYVILPRTALLEFFGEMALPPWHDHRGKIIGEHVDCAPIASRISEWLDAHDLTGVVRV